MGEARIIDRPRIVTKFRSSIFYYQKLVENLFQERDWFKQQLLIKMRSFDSFLLLKEVYRQSAQSLQPIKGSKFSLDSRSPYLPSIYINFRLALRKQYRG